MTGDHVLTRSEFPRANGYDPEWVMDNQMGPNALWLVEWLTQTMQLKPGMRVLDLGCGRALTSIFLAREYDVSVWAGDLWIGPDQNWERVVTAGVEGRVCPMRLEAHALPFAHGFFDAVISIDAYTYFGTDDLYLEYLSGFIKPGGAIGVVVPGLTREVEQVPVHLAQPQENGKVFWEDECWCFHSPEWWARHWRRCGKVTDVESTLQPEGWRHWRDFEVAVAQAGKGIFPSDAEALTADQGELIGLVRVTAKRTTEPGMDLYDPALGVRVGVDR